ncbi:ribonuclease H-like domain-containing protein [Tanacetum coccineum]
MIIFMASHDHQWCMDTGATSHLSSYTGNLQSSFLNHKFHSVIVGNGSFVPVTHSGHVQIPNPYRPSTLKMFLPTPSPLNTMLPPNTPTSSTPQPPPPPPPTLWLHKSLYGLKQTPELGFSDFPAMPFESVSITAKLTRLLQRIISSLHSEFSMTDLGPINYFLDISATRTPTGMFLSQLKYAIEILERANMLKCNPCKTLVNTEKKLGPDGPLVTDPTLYRKPHLAALKHVDWAGCPATRHSTSGYYVFLGDNLLSWPFKYQHTLSRSSVEAEYRGVANVVAETAWIRNLLIKLQAPLFTATLVYCDNVSVVYMSANPVQHQRTKHKEIDIYFVRDKVATGHIQVLHVPSRYQYADIFTKGLPYPLFANFRSSLSVHSPLAQTEGCISHTIY